MLTFLSTNGAEVAAIIISAYALAVAVTKVTPTQADDRVVKSLSAPITALIAFLKRDKSRE